MDDCNVAIQLDPGHLPAYLCRGFARFHLQRPGPALEDLERAAKLQQMLFDRLVPAAAAVARATAATTSSGGVSKISTPSGSTSPSSGSTTTATLTNSSSSTSTAAGVTPEQQLLQQQLQYTYEDIGGGGDVLGSAGAGTSGAVLNTILAPAQENQLLFIIHQIQRVREIYNK